MRLHRFYINKPLGEELVVVEKELVHQWIHVFRYTVGDEVMLFSPHIAGEDSVYRISSHTKTSVTLSQVTRQPHIIPSSNITLFMAVVKKDTFETIARQATELGVTSIVPILSARSEKKNLNIERLQAIVTEAAEQSGRGTVPTIEAICTFDEALQKTSGLVNIVASLRAQAHPVSDTSTCALWIGPEGGWTEEEEKAFAEKGFVSLRLTETTLKADTAAVAAITSILATTW